MKTILSFLALVGTVAAGADQPSAAFPKNDAVLERLGIRYEAAPTPPADAPPRKQEPVTGEFAESRVWLDPYIISSTPVKLTERQLLTGKGRIEYAKQRYLSPAYRVTFGPLSQVATYLYSFPTILGGWHPNDAEAMNLYWEDERFRMTREVDDLTRLGSVGAGKDAESLREIRYQFRNLRLGDSFWSR